MYRYHILFAGQYSSVTVEAENWDDAVDQILEGNGDPYAPVYDFQLLSVDNG